jgi:uncharacterized protein (TIGR00266 family)
MKYEIYHDHFSALDIHLQPGDSVYTQTGNMVWLKGNVQIASSTRGGLLQGLARSLAGDALFLTEYQCHKGRGLVTFTTSLPGQILPLTLQTGENRFCAKAAFMVAESSVELMPYLRRKLSGPAGEETFVLQTISGPGTCWLEVGGSLRQYDLRPGEVLQVQPAHLVMYEASVNHELERLGGIKNLLFGGEGIFLSTLKGPGRVWLQTHALATLGARLLPYLPGTKGSDK